MLFRIKNIKNIDAGSSKNKGEYRIMQRYEELGNLLQTIFGRRTIRTFGKGNKMGSDMLSKCKYNGNSLENFIYLFRYVFLSDQSKPEGIESDNKIEETLKIDRSNAINNAISYLRNRRIYIDTEQESKIPRQIFDVFSKIILPAIIIEPCKGEVSQFNEISEIMEKAYLDAAGLIYNHFNDFSTLPTINNIYQNDDCKTRKISIKISKYSDKRLEILKELFTLNVRYVRKRTASDNESIKENSFKEQIEEALNDSGLVSEKYPTNKPKYSIKDYNVIQQLYDWEYFYNPDYSKISFSEGFDNSIEEQYSRIIKEGDKKVDDEISVKIKPLFEDACECIEELTSAIIKINYGKGTKIDAENKKICKENMEDFLKKKCEKIIFDFGCLNMKIDKGINDRPGYEVYFLILQDLIIGLTSFFKRNDQYLSELLSKFIDCDKFDEHIDKIKSAKKSKDLELLIEIGTNEYNSNEKFYKASGNAIEYFCYRKPEVMHNFKEALNKYYECLTNARKNLKKLKR